MNDIDLARQLASASNCDTHPNEWPQLRPLLRRMAQKLEDFGGFLDLLEETLETVEDYTNPEKGITRYEAILFGVEKLNSLLGSQAKEMGRLGNRASRYKERVLDLENIFNSAYRKSYLVQKLEFEAVAQSQAKEIELLRSDLAEAVEHLENACADRLFPLCGCCGVGTNCVVASLIKRVHQRAALEGKPCTVPPHLFDPEFCTEDGCWNPETGGKVNCTKACRYHKDHEIPDEE